MKILKPFEAAEILNVSVNTLQRWDREGTLYANRTPTNRRYYTDEQLEMFLFDTRKEHSMNSEFYEDLVAQAGFLDDGECIKLEQVEPNGEVQFTWGIERITALDMSMLVLGLIGNTASIEVLPFDRAEELAACDLEEYFERMLESGCTWRLELEPDEI